MSDKSPSTVLYADLLSDIKQRVRHAQTRAWLSVNAEMIRLYWDVGAMIDCLRPLILFRRHVMQRPHRLPRAGERDIQFSAGTVGQVDFGLKTAASQARQLLATVQEVRAAVRDGQHRSDL